VVLSSNLEGGGKWKKELPKSSHKTHSGNFKVSDQGGGRKRGLEKFLIQLRQGRKVSGVRKSSYVCKLGSEKKKVRKNGGPVK